MFERRLLKLIAIYFKTPNSFSTHDSSLIIPHFLKTIQSVS